MLHIGALYVRGRCASAGPPKAKSSTSIVHSSSRFITHESASRLRCICAALRYSAKGLTGGDWANHDLWVDLPPEHEKPARSAGSCSTSGFEQSAPDRI